MGNTILKHEMQLAGKRESVLREYKKINSYFGELAHHIVSRSPIKQIIIDGDFKIEYPEETQSLLNKIEQQRIDHIKENPEIMYLLEESNISL
jgi:hypothetical protein